MSFFPRPALALSLFLSIPVAAHAAAYRTVVVFGDTQQLVVAKAEDPSPGFLRFLEMTQWVVDNQKSENIDFVLHVGDITQHGVHCTWSCDESVARTVNAEWDRFMEGWSIIEAAGIPYAIVPGNHDNVYPLPAQDPRTTPVDAFATFFGRSRFAGTQSHLATCDGATPDDRCHGQSTLGHVWKFQLGGQDVLVAGLPDRPAFGAQAWFQGVLEAHPDTPAILLSHQWLRPFDLLWFRYLATGRGGSLGPLTAQVFMTAMGHFTQDLKRILEFGEYRILAVEFDRQGVVGSGDAGIALIRFYFDPESLDGVDALRVEPGPVFLRNLFPGRVPFSIDGDLDNDDRPDVDDNCPEVANPEQRDLDQDWIGDACDDDLDGDGAPNEADNCPDLANPEQVDANADGVGNRCDADFDEDGEVDRHDLRILRRCARSGPEVRRRRHAALCREADMDVSGSVGPEDLALFLEQCGEACQRRKGRHRGVWQNSVRRAFE